jgi:helicase required for RNAi-mediated heterochromatin assembly 1
MLTCRLALIQGPPGTGKTYVGLKAVQNLLENVPGQIVIACQTNHALDQFLEGL